MKKITDDQSKIELVAHLVKEGHIDFTDAIKLLEVEYEYVYTQVPDWVQPYNPYQVTVSPLDVRYSSALSFGSGGSYTS